MHPTRAVVLPDDREACLAERGAILGRHVGDHRDVVVRDPHAAQQHAAAGGLQDPHLDTGGLEHPRNNFV